MADRLLTAKQIAPMIGYETEQYRAVYQRLVRAGIEPWRDPAEGSRRVAFWESDVQGYLRKGGGGAVRREQPASPATSRFRKQPAA